jgi:hypothetical protein
MLLQEQPEYKFLLDSFWESKCCDIFTSIFTVILTCIFFYSWFEINIIYFKPEDIFAIMIIEFEIAYLIVLQVIGFWRIFELKQNTPDLSYFSIILNNIELLLPLIILILGVVIFVVIRYIF